MYKIDVIKVNEIDNNQLSDIYNYLKLKFEDIIDTVLKGKHYNICIEFKILNNINIPLIEFYFHSNNIRTIKDNNIDLFDLCIQRYADAYTNKLSEQLNLNNLESKINYIENKNPIIKAILISIIDSIFIRYF